MRPAARPLVLNVAVVTPPLVLKLPVPSVVEPSLKVTVPVGVPAPGATTATVAVRVTVWPSDGLAGEKVRAVVVAACLTIWDRADDVRRLRSSSRPSTPP